MTDEPATLADRGGLRSGVLVLAGAGKMGGALLDGWLEQGLDPHHVTIVDPHAAAEGLRRFTDRGVALNPAQPAPAATLVLAIKPQSLAQAASDLGRWIGPDTLLVSIVAGKRVADLARAFPEARSIARTMPNTPAAIRRGMTGLYADPGLSPAQRHEVETLLRAAGAVEWMDDESLIDAVTAVSGSGPAYVFYLTECLAAAAESAGLAPAAAARLARATVEGAAALMAAQPDVPPATLRANVTSPGGTTAAAIDVLKAGGRLERAMTEAVAAAKQRAVHLAG